MWAVGLQRKAGLRAALHLIFYVISGRLREAVSGGHQQQNTQHGEKPPQPGPSVSRQWSPWVGKAILFSNSNKGSSNTNQDNCRLDK